MILLIYLMCGIGISLICRTIFDHFHIQQNLSFSIGIVLISFVIAILVDEIHNINKNIKRNKNEN